jgi:hypothetical protein
LKGIDWTKGMPETTRLCLCPLGVGFQKSRNGLSQECRALGSTDFYFEKYWMNVDEETGEDGMNILNEHNSIAVENNNWQQYQSLTSTDSTDDENSSVARWRALQQVAPLLIIPSDCSENDNAINGGIDIATFFHGGRSTDNVHYDGKKF